MRQGVLTFVVLHKITYHDIKFMGKTGEYFFSLLCNLKMSSFIFSHVSFIIYSSTNNDKAFRVMCIAFTFFSDICES